LRENQAGRSKQAPLRAWVAVVGRGPSATSATECHQIPCWYTRRQVV